MTPRPSLLLLLAGSLALVSCGNEPDPEPVPMPLCDRAKCAPGNVCVQNRCMLACATHGGCPAGYDCRDVEGTRVCSANGQPVGQGTFGQKCNRRGDGDCDAALGFRCIGAGMALGDEAVVGDPEGYCTRSPCASDAECPGASRCVDLDVRGTQTTQKACVRRGFCDPAQGPVDCEGEFPNFARDLAGQGFCTRKCNPDYPNGCGGGNVCIPSGLCWPRSRVCAPTRTFCSRCLSRADCPTGALCYLEDYSKERFCTQTCPKPALECPDASAGGLPGDCYDFGEIWGPQCLPHMVSQYDPPRCWLPCPGEPGCP